jgi:hypothetical protein
MSNGLEARLKAALAGRKTIEMGQFQMLNLDMVRAETGEQWIPLRKKIYNVAVHFIEKRLHPDDVLVRCRGGFILVFAHLSGHEAKERVARLSDQLNAFFLGDRVLKQLEIRADARTVTASELAQVVATASKGSRDDSVEGGRRSTDRPAEQSGRGPRWKDGEAPSDKQAGSWTGNRDGGRKDGQWVGDDGAKRGTAPPQWSGPEDMAEDLGEEVAPDAWPEEKKSEPVPASSQSSAHAAAQSATSTKSEAASTGASKKKAANWKQVSAERDEGDRASRKPASKETSSKKSPDKEPSTDDTAVFADLPKATFTEAGPNWDDLIFKPCWDAKNAAISTYFCMPRRIAKDGSPRYGRDVLPPGASLDLHRAMDRSVAIAAQRGFQQTYADGGACAIAIPVHYDTIQGVTDRVSYFSILQSVPQHLRRYFFFRVDHIPVGAPLSQMEELFRSMKCFGSNILAKVDYGQADLKTFENCGIDLFGSEVPRRMNDGFIDETAIMGLAGMVRAATANNAEVFLTHVGNFDVLNAAVTAGVRYFAGTAIGPEVGLPKPIKSLSFADLQARNAKRAA